MSVLGMDIGGKTRNGICLINDKEEILYTETIPYDNEKTPMEHRFKILNSVENIIKDSKNVYKDPVEFILFERINLFRGGYISQLANILSLGRLQCTLIDNLSDKVSLYDVAVKSWKAKVLGSGNATKEDSIAYVQKYYPDVNLEFVVEYKRKENEIIMNHDLADSIMIALYGIRYKDKITSEKTLNFL